jgi:hypothetical protein
MSALDQGKGVGRSLHTAWGAMVRWFYSCTRGGAVRPAPTRSRGQGVVQETSAPFRPNCPSDKNFLGLDAPGPALAAELDG